MKNGARKAGVLCGAAFASALLGATTATHAAAQSSTLMIGGIYTPSLSDRVMGSILGGRFRGEQLISVEWPAKARPFTGLFGDTLSTSVNIGIENLTEQLSLAIDRLDTDADGNYLPNEKVTVVGLSAGSLVVDEVLRNLAAETGDPDRDILTFYTIENTTLQRPQPVYNPFINYTFEPQPVTQYDVVNVTGEYDGFADYPQRWWNVLAVANAVLGEIFVHIPVMFKDLDKVEKTVTVTENDQGGTTTTYFVRAERLPLVVVFPFLKPFEAGLRAIVDAGYTRNDPDIAQTASEDALTVAADAASGEQEVAPDEGESQSADVEAGGDGDGTDGDAVVAEDVSLDADEAGAVAGDAVGALAGQVSGGDDNNARTEDDIAGQSERAVADEVTETGATEAEAEATEAEAESDGADGADQTETGGASAEAAGESGTDGGPAADADAAEPESAPAE